MAASDSGHDRMSGDQLFDESPACLLVVGQLPETLLTPVAGVSVHRLASLEEAEAMANKLGSSIDSEPADAKSAMQSADMDHQAMTVPASLVLQLSTDTLHRVQEQLGRAVRAFSHRVLVHVEADKNDTALTDDVFFALGFRRLDNGLENEHADSRLRWFEYRLSQYKPSPEWLNARFWANPERYDMDDDPDSDYESTDEEE